MKNTILLLAYEFYDSKVISNDLKNIVNERFLYINTLLDNEAERRLNESPLKGKLWSHNYISKDNKITIDINGEIKTDIESNYTITSFKQLFDKNGIELRSDPLYDNIKNSDINHYFWIDNKISYTENLHSLTRNKKSGKFSILLKGNKPSFSNLDKATIRNGYLIMNSNSLFMQNNEEKHFAICVK